MNILITGAGGFIGKNLTVRLKSIRDKKDRSRSIPIEDIYECGRATSAELLDEYCKNVDFVFNLAGANRPEDKEEYMRINRGFAEELLKRLKKHGNTCPVMYASSVQAVLDNDYGRSKKAGEELLFDYANETGAKVLIYRFTNVFGKWCRPDYNSAVATFCHNIANGLPVSVSDPNTVLELTYIDDLVSELLDALEGKEHQKGGYCFVPKTYTASLGRIVGLLESYEAQPRTLFMPSIPEDSFEKKLYSTYLSYLPSEKIKFPFNMNTDARGSFTELIRTAGCGQISVNIQKPGTIKGGHRHDSKCELFTVVSGHGLIRQRRIDSDEVLEFEVSGDKIEAVHILPGYTHEIINLSEENDLVTLMWANECFDKNRPDTFSEPV